MKKRNIGRESSICGGIRLIIVPGPASRYLGLRVAELLGVRTVEVESKFFPDGESYVRFKEDPKGADVVIVQSTYPPQDTHLLQLLLLSDTALRLGAETVTVVVPYLAYSRQDRDFRPYEPISIRTVLKLIKSCGVSRLITLNIHEPSVLKNSGLKAENLSAVPNLTEYLVKLGLSGAVALAPDEKAVKMAMELAETLRGGYGRFAKKRDRLTGEINITSELQVAVEGKDIVIVDDIISSGSTTAAAVRELKARGARRVYAACVHPILAPGAYEKIKEVGAEAVIGTDTIPSKVSLVTVAPTIAQALRII
ncbi:MAG: ribose-phosphate diphosphokinase [Candidatus Bathyarchaeia archaeon]